MASYIRTKYISLTLFKKKIIKVSLLNLWPCLLPCVPDEKVTPSDSCWWYYCELWESSECPLSPMQPKKIYFHSMSEDGEVKFNHSFLLYRTQCVWHDMWGLPLFLQQQSCLTHLLWTQASLFQLVILNKIILDPDKKLEAFWWKSTSKLDQKKNMNKKIGQDRSLSNLYIPIPLDVSYKRLYNVQWPKLLTFKRVNNKWCSGNCMYYVCSKICFKRKSKTYTYGVHPESHSSNIQTVN